MRLARRSIGWVGAFCLLGVSLPAVAADAPPAPPPAKPDGAKPDAAKPATSAPTTAPTAARVPAKNVVPAAIVALQKEYQTYIKDPKSGKLREKSDYFKENPSPDATTEAIMKGLETSVGGGAEAYVKWQLLSAVPGKFPDDMLKRAVAVYRRAPLPVAHPGLNHRGLNREIKRVKKDEIAGIQKDLDDAAEQAKETNAIVVGYRDELYGRMPLKTEVLYAGLEDTSIRAGHGLNATKIFDNVSAGIRSWSIAEAKAGQVRQMMDTVLRLKDQVASEDAKPYVKLVDDKGVVKWIPGNPPVDPKKVDELVKFMENNAAGSAIGGLKFKDTKK